MRIRAEKKNLRKGERKNDDGDPLTPRKGFRESKLGGQ